MEAGAEEEAEVAVVAPEVVHSASDPPSPGAVPGVAPPSARTVGVKPPRAARTEAAGLARNEVRSVVAGRARFAASPARCMAIR